jgi:hypothetical protein
MLRRGLEKMERRVLEKKPKKEKKTKNNQGEGEREEGRRCSDDWERKEYDGQ